MKVLQSATKTPKPIAAITSTASPMAEVRSFVPYEKMSTNRLVL